MTYTFAVYDKRPRAAYTQLGALISVLSCSIIVVAYLRKRKWRQHPNSLLFWKSAVDLLFAVRFQYDWDQFANRSGCRVLATTTQFCSFASECWFVCMSLNLYQCATNPFTNVQANMRWFHTFSWSVGLFFAAMLWVSEVEFNPRADPACFVDESDTNFLLMYYGVVVLSVACAVAFSILETRSHSHGGMNEALAAKKGVIRSARIFTTAYIIYQSILILLWVADMVVFDQNESVLQVVRNVTSFLQTSKGAIDLVIWLCINNWSRLECFGCCKRRRRLKTSALPTSRTSRSSPMRPMDEASALSSTQSTSSHSDDRFSDVDIDLQPQLNVALRKEVLHFTTRGIVAASSNALAHAPQAPPNDTRRVVRLRLHELGMTVRFNDYNPSSFRDIRRGFGIRETLFRKSFLATCHERIQSGGSSGAFMFYTADYAFIVKSVTRSERAVLLRMLPAYIKYMKANPGSHLTRFYGCHSIEMYGQDFSFVVMGNAIGRVSMHQFYDIKGSWIDRNAEAIPPGKTVICTYCSNAFKYGSGESCDYSIHGTHLPHIVLKDNDFRRKLRVLPDTAQELVAQLVNDSNFLCDQGIMDYSLLLSVHSTKYVVDHTQFDPNNLLRSPTKRKVNYPVCHPDNASDDAYNSVSFSSSALVRDEPVDDDDDNSHTSSDEDLADIEVGNRRKFNRTCRYSVVGFNDESMRKLQVDTPLLAHANASHGSLSGPSLMRYDSMAPVPFDVGSPITDQSKWIGRRTLEKVGYQASAVVGPDYYTLGVVDMLQTWTWRKRLERLWKTLVLRHDGHGISAAPPKLYAERFQSKCREITMASSTQIGFGNH